MSIRSIRVAIQFILPIVLLNVTTLSYGQAESADAPSFPTVEEIFTTTDESTPIEEPHLFNGVNYQVSQTDAPCLEDACCPTDSGSCGPFDTQEQNCWVCLDHLSLSRCKNQELCEGWTYSVGGALQYRFIDESNRLRPPLAAGRSSYQQWRFSPDVELKRGNDVTLYAQMVDASTFGNDLVIVPIDENRWDLHQAYIDLNVWEFEQGDLRYRYGRQWLIYGAQHLLSNLGWGNTFRNFQGHRAYYADDTWKVDLLAMQGVNGAARGALYNLNSFDSPNQDQWLGGVYATYQKLRHGVLDMYWLWSDVNSNAVNVINGSRHTIGARWAGKRSLNGVHCKPAITLDWDVEGAWQFGQEDYLAGPSQDIQAGFVSTIGKLTFDDVMWKPTVTGLFWWGSGDDDPNDGTSHTVSTLYPLGHAYWGMIDNFNGSNLLDYSVQLNVKPTSKLSFLTAWHWFDKAAEEDAIYNVGGVPFGGVNASQRNLGHELDLMATYQLRENIQLQLGYFWFWYGDGVNSNANAAVANRDDAEQVYFIANWNF